MDHTIWRVPDILLGYTDCSVEVWSPCLVKDRGKGQKCEGKSTSLSPQPEGDADSGASVFGGRSETHREVGCISSGTLVLRVPQLPNSFSKMCRDETLGTESLSGIVRQPPRVITSWLWDHT